MSRVCFIGHRDAYGNYIREKLVFEVRKELENGTRFFTMGTHGQFDKMALSVCKELRKDYNDMQIDVVLTSYNIVAKRLLKTTKNEDGGIEMIHEENNAYEDVNTIMYNIEEEYFLNRIKASNRMMVDDCDTLICYVDEKQRQSGARTTMNYAKRKGLRIINLYDEKDSPTYGMTKEQAKEYYKNLFTELDELTKKIEKTIGVKKYKK